MFISCLKDINLLSVKGCTHVCMYIVLQVAAPMVVGMLAFGGKWESLLGLDPTGMYPIKLAEDHSSTAKKVRCCFCSRTGSCHT
jgi:hypothetical protein